MNRVTPSSPPSMQAKQGWSIRTRSSTPAAFADPADEAVAKLAHARPDGAVGTHADPIRADAVGPRSAVRELSVGSDVERRELSNDLPDDQRRVVRRHDHAVVAAMPSATRRTEPSGVIRAMIPGGARPPGLEFAAAVDVDVAAAVDDKLVEIVDVEAAEVGMGHERTVGLLRMSPSPVTSRRPSASQSIDHPRPGVFRRSRFALRDRPRRSPWSPSWRTRDGGRQRGDSPITSSLSRTRA